MLEAKLLRLLPALVLAASTMVFSSGTPAAAAGSSCSGKSDDRSADNWASTETDLCLRASNRGWSYGAITFTCWKGQVIGWDRVDCDLSGLASLTKTQDGTTRKVYDRRANLRYTYSVHGDSVTYNQNFTFTCTPGATYAFTLSGAHTIQGNDQNTEVDIPNRTVADVPCK